MDSKPQSSNASRHVFQRSKLAAGHSCRLDDNRVALWQLCLSTKGAGSAPPDAVRFEEVASEQVCDAAPSVEERFACVQITMNM